MNVIIVGAGIGGLTLALTLHRAGIPCRVYESALEIKEVGVGINLLPHATTELAELGLEEALTKIAVTTREAVFFNRFGQLIYSEPLGRYAGYRRPQFSIHRGELQAVLLEACKNRIGADRIVTGWRCVHADQDQDGVTVHFRSSRTDQELESQRASVVIGCDGINSALRKQLYPAEGAPLYSGVNMWRGVTRWQPFLSGATFVRAGWIATGKAVIYPIRNNIDPEGRQLVNWVAEVETPHHKLRDWNRPGKLDDFITRYEDWRFDWLDVPAFFSQADTILEFPMVDQDPLPRWSFGRMTLLGDAAHPMYPRGSNGAGQAILDARALGGNLGKYSDPVEALKAYEFQRLDATANIVRMNRRNPPDAILREVYVRTGDRPFRNIDDVITRDELAALSDGYKRVAGYDRETPGAARSVG
jgi:2-polyprenyl-6-methoxyphenol hydroxylase-like FAD-dependent oxidoreductase